MKKIGSVLCKTFLTEFFRLGQDTRHKNHSEQIKKQRALSIAAHDAHLKKIQEVANSEVVRIAYEFTDDHLQSALDKLTNASIKYDKIRGSLWLCCCFAGIGVLLHHVISFESWHTNANFDVY